MLITDAETGEHVEAPAGYVLEADLAAARAQLAAVRDMAMTEQQRQHPMDSRAAYVLADDVLAATSNPAAALAAVRAEALREAADACCSSDAAMLRTLADVIDRIEADQ